MKAAHITTWCAQGTVADAILFGQVPSLPPPTKTNVLITVKASSVNVDDVAILQDTAAGGWCFHGRKPTVAQPFVGGIEYSGVVAAIGPGVVALKVGDRVCGIQDVMAKRPGTWSEQTMAPEKDIVLIPAECDISFVQAAAMGMGACVSGDMYKRAQLQKPAKSELRCLVVGASGGLGTVLLQLLKQHKGPTLHIVAVCSSANEEKVRRLGADEVVDYHVGPFGSQLKDQPKFDVVFDFVGGKPVEQDAKRVMKKGAKFITACGPMAAVGDRQLSCCEWYGWACGLTCRLCACCAATKYEMAMFLPPMKAMDFNAFVVETGIRAEIAMEVPFVEASVREALRRVASRHPGGKVVFNMEKEGSTTMATVESASETTGEAKI